MQQQNQQVLPPTGFAQFQDTTGPNGQQGYMAQLDATTAALLMNPHTAAAVAAVAAAAAQQMHHAQHMHQQHFQLMNALPPGVQQILSTANAMSGATASGSMPNAIQNSGTNSSGSSTPPSPQPGQQPQHITQGQGSTNGHSKTHLSGQHYSIGVPHHVAAMMGFPPGITPAALPSVVTMPNGSPITINGAPAPQHAIQLSFTAPSPAPQSQLPVPIPSSAVATSSVQVMAHQQSVNTQYSNNLLVNMQNWKVNQLEAHVLQLQSNKQAVPQPVAMLLADARRKEEKRTAKRVANRKSACSSRARKKALVEEMTKTNARLRRQALILSLLPDLVIAISVEGEITFCSAQVERVLRYPIDDLLGANLTDLLVPASRESLNNLIGELVAAERAASSGDVAAEPTQDNPAVGLAGDEEKDENGNARNLNGDASADSSKHSSGAPVVSDQSFPLSVVKVQSVGSGGDENSDLSTSNNGCEKNAGATGSKNSGGGAATKASPSSFKGEDQRTDAKQSSTKKKGQKESSSDDSFSSCSDAKQIRKANENLSRNVRWHNEQMNKKGKAKRAHMDDVLGAFVTANNAGARLSSLQHRPCDPLQVKAKSENENEEDFSSSSDSLIAGPEEARDQLKVVQPKTGHDQNSSDDSGYRESNESAREDASSTESESSSNGPNAGRPKPLAPTCNICLIRDDLTTIWCEVTSSIRTRSLREEIAPEDAEFFGGLGKSTTGSSERGTSRTDSSKPVGAGDPTESSASVEEESAKEEIKELLLCLRPIRDGVEVVSEALRFVPISVRATQTESSDAANVVTNGGSIPHASNSSNCGSGFGPASPNQKRPPKKRPISILQKQEMSVTKVSTGSSSQDGGSNIEPRLHKKPRHDEESAEKSVVESLMLMSNNTN